MVLSSRFVYLFLGFDACFQAGLIQFDYLFIGLMPVSTGFVRLFDCLVVWFLFFETKLVCLFDCLIVQSFNQLVPVFGQDLVGLCFGFGACFDKTCMFIQLFDHSVFCLWFVCLVFLFVHGLVPVSAKTCSILVPANSRTCSDLIFVLDRNLFVV